MSKTEDADQNSAQPAKSTTTDYRDPNTLKPHPKNSEIYGKEKLKADFVESIRVDGIHNPLIITSENVIISGHRRRSAALEANLDTVPVQIRDYETALEERRAVLISNKQREKSKSQKIREARELEDIERQWAKQRQGTRTDLGKSIKGGEKGQTRDIVAKTVGLGSGETYRQAKYVLEAAEDGISLAQEQLRELDAGEQSVNGAYKTIQAWNKQMQKPHLVSWDELDNISDIHTVDSIAAFFQSRKRNLSKTEEWFFVSRKLAGEMFASSFHQQANKLSNGADDPLELAIVFGYLLEKEGYTVFNGDISDNSSQKMESLMGRKPSTSTLEELYHEQNKTRSELAMLYGVGKRMIEFWLREDQISMKMDEFTKAEQKKIRANRS